MEKSKFSYADFYFISGFSLPLIIIRWKVKMHIIIFIKRLTEGFELCFTRIHWFNGRNSAHYLFISPCLLPAGWDGRSNNAIVAAENSRAFTWPWTSPNTRIASFVLLGLLLSSTNKASVLIVTIIAHFETAGHLFKSMIRNQS